MAQKMINVCLCRQCRRARRGGMILGKAMRREDWSGQETHYVSVYVSYHKYARGRKRKMRKGLYFSEE